MEEYKNLPLKAFATMSEWLTWLEHNHASSGIWLKFAKKGTGIPTVTYEEAREAAIMYGWIDGLINRYDEQYYLIRFMPRKPKSVWSKVNREIAEELIVAGKMQPSGLVQVEAAQADGRWDAAYDPSSTIEVPPDLEAELKKRPKAEAFFQSLNKSNRYAILYRLQTATNPTVRKNRLEKCLAMLEAGETFH